MQIVSTAFQDNALIPPKYTCDGENINPPLTFSETPVETKSLVLIVEDPDAPRPNFTHWLLYNIPSSVLQILENSVPAGTLQGYNDFGDVEYGGPCPTEGSHRYFFHLYALDTILDVPAGAPKSLIRKKIADHIISTTDLVGLYEKQPQA